MGTLIGGKEPDFDNFTVEIVGPMHPPSAPTQARRQLESTAAAAGAGAPKSLPQLHHPIEYIAITALSFSSARLLLFYSASVLSLGVLPIVCKYYPPIWAFLARAPCSHFRDADFVLVLCRDGAYQEIPVERIISKIPLAVAGGLDIGPTTKDSEFEVDESNGGVNEEGPDLHSKQAEPGQWEEGRNEQRRQRSFTFFEYKKQRYVFREGTSTFQRMSSTLNISASDIHNLRRGMPGSEALSILQRNGPNTIDVDPVPIWQLLYDKTLHPFYLFQIASVIIWTYELYYLYAILIAVTSSASVFWEIYLTKYNETTLREYIEPESFCTVLRDGEPTVISTHHLVVGDAVLIDEAAAPAVADMVLVQGSCIVDESSLTGESVPVVKSSLDIYDRGEERYRPEGRFKDCTIFGGSKIVEVKPMPYGYKPQEGDCTPRAIGIVTATGFNSTKGELFRSILYPNRIDFKFYRDSVAFVGVLGVIALIAFINRLVKGLSEEDRVLTVLITSLDLITIAVPPALPLVLTVGATMALRRLKSKGIFCICPDRINYAGRIDTFCWDKTGTLTSSKVELHGLEPCENRRLLGLAPSFRSRYRDEQPTTFEEATAVCNSLSSVNGELVGSPIDLELFRAAAGWTLNQLAESVTLNGRAVPVLARAVPPKPRPTSSAPSSARTSIASRPSSASHQQTTMSLSAHDPSIHDPTALLVLRRFPFDAQLQRASVVYAADDGTARLRVAVKGSPEAVRILCRPNTLPLDYYEAVSGFAASGFYVLAVASRDVDASCQAVSSSSLAAPVTPKGGRRKPGGGVGVGGSARRGSRSHLQESAKTPDLFVGSVGDLCREQVERDLKFEGFAVFKNPLKADSAATIAVLKDANIQNVIITGDSAMTAISVARDLELCRDVLLVDVFERGLAVRLLPLEAAKKSPQSSTFPTAVAAANTSETESTTSSLTRQRPRSATLHSSMDQLALPAANSHRNVQRSRKLSVSESAKTSNCLNAEPVAPRAPEPANRELAKNRNEAVPRVFVPLADMESDRDYDAGKRGSGWGRSQSGRHLSASCDNLGAGGVGVNDTGNAGGGGGSALGRRSSRSGSLLLSTSRLANGPRGGVPSVGSGATNKLATFPLSELGRLYASLQPGSAEIVVTGAALEVLVNSSSDSGAGGGILMVGEHKVDDAFLDWVIGKTRVFARARPDQKSWIVRRLMGIGRHVGMCGDGANDTGALKAAHVGLALSEAEASIVAPFTSVRKRVSDVPALLAEGRCALETSFMAFKYMFMYPIVQLYLAAIVNQLGSGLSGTEFLFDDTFVVLVLALLMLRTGPSARLIRDRPTDTLFSPLITVSLGGHVILCLSFFAINLIAVAEQPWFCSAFTAVSGVDPFHSWSPLNASAPSASTYPCYPIDPALDTIDSVLVASYESTYAWLFTHLQFAILALAFAAGSVPPRHRKPLHTHLSFLAYWLTIVVVMVLLILSPDAASPRSFVSRLFSLRFPDPDWRPVPPPAAEGGTVETTATVTVSEEGVATVAIAVVNLAACLLWEIGFVDRVVRRWVERREAADAETRERRTWRRVAGWDGEMAAVSELVRGVLRDRSTAAAAAAAVSSSARSVGGAAGTGTSSFAAESADAFERMEEDVESAALGRSSAMGARGMDLAAAMQVARSWGDLTAEDGANMGRMSGWRRMTSPTVGALPDLETGRPPGRESRYNEYSDR